MKTIFEKIIDQEIPGVFIYQDPICVAIMDLFPMTRGQCMVIPRDPVDYIFDLDDATYTHCMSVAQKIAQAIDASLKPLRTCMVVEGFEIPHAHIKLIPCYENELPSSAGTQSNMHELQKTAELISKKLFEGSQFTPENIS